MKILYITTIGGTMSFFESFIGELVKEGNIVDIACNNSMSNVPLYYEKLGCKIYQIDTSRSPFSIGNIHAIKQIKTLVEKERYDIVHCHTPIAAMCTRIACRAVRKKGTRVFYTAHGFHFFKGAPSKNWLLFYPIEKICSYFTDVLITINKEDYDLAKKKMRAKKIAYVPGVGIDLEKFSIKLEDKTIKRKELGIEEKMAVLLSVGELNENKNHEVIIRAIAKLNNPQIHYFIAGRGELNNYLERLANQLNISSQIHLLGYRNDIVELLQVADVFCFPSKREGLGLAAIEAMACGVPLVTSYIHGIKDYSQNNFTGYNCDPNDIEGFAHAIDSIISSEEKRGKFATYNREIAKQYSIEIINKRMKELYFV